MKKQIFFTVLFFLAALPAGAQLYQPGEVLDYRASYKAKFFLSAGSRQYPSYTFGVAVTSAPIAPEKRSVSVADTG